MIRLLIKNFKFKIFNKKLSLKYIGFFKIEGVVRTQIYRLILFLLYYIYFIFYISFLEPYKRRFNDDKILKIFFPELINNKKKYEIKKILNKIFKKKEI